MISGEDFYQFRHMVLQQAAYELHAPSVRGLLHRLALPLLEDAEAPAAELAAHALAGHEGASAPERAALGQARKRHLRAAAEFALSQYRNRDSLALLELLTALDLTPEESVDTDCRAADVLYRLGRGAEAVTRADRAVAQARKIEGARLVAKACSVRGTVCMDSARSREAEMYLREAVALLRTFTDKPALATTLARLCTAVWLTGRPVEALPIAAEAVEVAGGKHIPAQLNTINILMQLGRLEEAKTLAEPLREALANPGDAYMRCILGNTFGILHDYLGDREQAAKHYEAVCVAAREAGLLAELARGLTNLGGVHFGRFEYSRALAKQEEAEAIAREIGDTRIGWYALRGQADTLETIGDYRSSVQRDLAAVRLAELSGMPDLSAMARVAAAECFVHLHQPEEAIEQLEVAQASKALANQPLFALFSHAIMAMALHGCGKDGREHLRLAEELLPGATGFGAHKAPRLLKQARERLGVS